MAPTLLHLPFAAIAGLSLAGGYLLGSIPFGVIAARLGGAGDIRTIGSGNIGATNVLRTGRRDLALITLIGDIGKGVAAVLIARALFGDQTAPAIAGGAAFLGHLFSVWLGFKGGKGVAVAAGVLFAIAWPVGLACAAVWLAVILLTRLVSLASLAAAAVAPIWLVVFRLESRPALALFVVMAVLVFLKHAANIRRLISGQEPKIGRSTAGAAP